MTKMQQKMDKKCMTKEKKSRRRQMMAQNIFGSEANQLQKDANRK